MEAFSSLWDVLSNQAFHLHCGNSIMDSKKIPACPECFCKVGMILIFGVALFYFDIWYDLGTEIMQYSTCPYPPEQCTHISCNEMPWGIRDTWDHGKNHWPIWAVFYRTRYRTGHILDKHFPARRNRHWSLPCPRRKWAVSQWNQDWHGCWKTPVGKVWEQQTGAGADNDRI